MSPAKRTDAKAAEPVVDDAEDLLTIANDDRDELWFWRQGGTRWEFLEKRTPTELRTSGIRPEMQAKFGGGMYRARLRDRSGHWGKSREFAIAGPPINPSPASAPASAPSSAPPATLSKYEIPEWVKVLVIPVLTAVGAGLAKRILEPAPGTDPALLRVLERMSTGGKAIDPIELQRLLLEAESRGEDRGRELGELGAQVEAPRGGDGAGVGGAIDRALPTLNRMIDLASENGRNKRRRLPAGPPASHAIAEPSSSAAAMPDIVPQWLRPFIGYKDALLNVADRGKSPEKYADMILDQVEDDEQLLLALAEANRAGRLLADLTAAIPEISATPARQKFAEQLVAVLTEELPNMVTFQEDEKPAPAPASDDSGAAAHG